MSWAQSKVLNPSPSFAYIQRCVPSKSSAFRSLLALSGLRSEADEEAEKTLALTPWTWAPREGQRWVQAGGACAVITPVPESPSPERPPRPGGLEQPSGRWPTCCGRESLSLLSFPFSYHLPPTPPSGSQIHPGHILCPYPLCSPTASQSRSKAPEAVQEAELGGDQWRVPVQNPAEPPGTLHTQTGRRG